MKSAALLLFAFLSLHATLFEEDSAGEERRSQRQLREAFRHNVSDADAIGPAVSNAEGRGALTV